MLADRVVAAVLLCCCAMGLAGCSLPQRTSSSQTVEHLLESSLSRPRDATTPVDTVVLHFSSDVLARPQRPFDLQRILAIYRDAGVSSHYVIQRDGTVYQLVDEDRVAFHARSWNPRSIGIELLAIGSERDMARYMDAASYARIPRRHLGYTAAQYTALNRLLEALDARHPDIRHSRQCIVGHDEIDPQRKSDPGELFEWSRIGLPAIP